ncbi:MAG: HAMP domain-containing protein, partial [Alphaproteobacteria bacterium]|nr:HAMP domain-containing protein [Alphaproteobacteria bacterium]
MASSDLARSSPAGRHSSWGIGAKVGAVFGCTALVLVAAAVICWRVLGTLDQQLDDMQRMSTLALAAIEADAEVREVNQLAALYMLTVKDQTEQDIARRANGLQDRIEALRKDRQVDARQIDALAGAHKQFVAAIGPLSQSLKEAQAIVSQDITMAVTDALKMISLLTTLMQSSGETEQIERGFTVRAQMSGAQTSMLIYAATRDKARVEEASNQLVAASINLDAVVLSTKDDGLQKIGQEIKKAVAVLEEKRARLVAVYDAQDKQRDEQLKPAFAAMQQAAQAIRKNAVDSTETTRVDADTQVTLIIWVLIGIGIAMAALGTFGLLGVNLFVVRPLEQVTAVTDRLASGDLEVEAPKVAQQDEIGRIARSVAVLRDNSREAARLR